MCELSLGSFNAKRVLPVVRSVQGRCRDSPSASIPSSAQHICVHESKHLRVHMHVLLAECVESRVAFVCFSGWRGKKNLEKKNNFHSFWNKCVRGGFSEMKETKKKPSNKTPRKKPCFNIICKIKFYLRRFRFKLGKKQTEMSFEMKMCRFILKIPEHHLIFLYLPPT